MAVIIHHLTLGAERTVDEAAATVWTISADEGGAGWRYGPLPDELRPPPDPRFIPAEPSIDPPPLPAPKKKD